MTAEERHEITVKRGGNVRADIKPERISGITEQIAYWRKANMIHKWFVDNVQDGEDDCREYYVSREQLALLVETCKEVLKSLDNSVMIEKETEVGTRFTEGKREPIMETVKVYPDKDLELVQRLLPPQGGFFFGSTIIGEWYRNDIADTIKMIEPELKTNPNGELYYCASW